jgi:putative DNA primase/helicase
MDHELMDLEPGDLGNARALIEAYGQDVRYVTDLGWHYWDGTRWQHDDDNAQVREYAKATARRLYATAKTFTFSQAADAAERIRRAQRSHEAARVSAMVKLAQSERSVLLKPEDFDRDPWRFTVANGTLDLRTGELHEYRREDLITKLAPVAYSSDAECPIFLAFLKRIMGGDADLIGFLQRLLG